jgi:hypothetical protein
LLSHINDSLREQCWRQVEDEIRFAQNDLASLAEVVSTSSDDDTTIIIPKQDSQSMMRAFRDKVTGRKTQLRVQRKGKEFDLCSWWKNCVCSNEIQFVARLFLAMPATSCPSERVFSQMKHLMGKLRVTASPSSIETLTLLRSAFQNNMINANDLFVQLKDFIEELQ